MGVTPPRTILIYFKVDKSGARCFYKTAVVHTGCRAVRGWVFRGAHERGKGRDGCAESDDRSVAEGLYGACAHSNQL